MNIEKIYGKLITVLGLIFMPVLLSAALNKPDSVSFVVAADGSGDFKTVQEAITAIPDLRKTETIVFIRKGRYKEKLTLPATKTNVTFIGEDRDSTILTFDDFASKKNCFGENIGTSGSSSFFVYGDGFTARNLTFENSAGTVGQAVAVRVTGDKARFFNCRFLGNQDTLYPHGRGSRQYYNGCYIEGTVDFIFGAATCLFDSCTIFAKSSGYLTAASTPQESAFGYVFVNCTITGTAPDGTVFLGRPWRPWAKTVFIDCDLGSVVNPRGWNDWNKPEAHQSTYYGEYNNRGPGALQNQRVDWMHTISENERERFSIDQIFQYQLIPGEGMAGWNPLKE